MDTAVEPASSDASRQRKYFGTDGIRGTVGRSPITADFMLKLGWAAGRVLARRQKTRVIIGKDTRISGYMFEAALEAGFSAAGVDVMLLGPMPTPGIAYMTQTFRADAGVVISASHNPFQDNGIKFFSAAGTKLGDAIEFEIEQELTQPLVTVDSEHLGKAVRIDDAAARYIEFCKSTVPGRFTLHGLKVVLDCANGATYHIAPSVFRELGATVTVIGASPDGLNINRNVGSTHTVALRAKVIETGADIGIAFDGDGDRVILIDAKGREVDGDDILYLIGSDRHRRGVLGGGVVGTVMSNLGLAQAFERQGIPFERANVGDRYVIERLDALGWQLGGESSGHIVCGHVQTTGDGIVAALQVLAIMMREGRSLEALLVGYEKAPQTLVNVRIGADADRGALLEDAGVVETLRAVEAELGSDGRVLLRPSGTEPLIRVMVEAHPRFDVERLAGRIAASIERCVQD
ncbi:phosphoglucosamine mutase [Halotalea alkalilenta]|uniref:Phosphoglucosamine mutase n=1 Tax=Halotalea alkalilenta TaxID=376489 RepID=A0A172YAN1_9GAMM|nr:phosphoglucosamine mutase [Halotalea alkalilenta]ANF56075.1 phosphoglucosamine mutase [Halotalea alkalilenta]